MSVSALEKYKQNEIKEGCVSLDSLKESFINFDKLRADTLSSLRSVDFLKIAKNKKDFIFIEISNLLGTLKSLSKNIKKKEKIRVKSDTYIVKEFLKREYREKLFESLFLFQFITGLSLKNKNIYFLIVVCSSPRSQRFQVFKFKYLEEFLNSLLPKEWNCKILSEEIFIKLLKRKGIVS